MFSIDLGVSRAIARSLSPLSTASTKSAAALLTASVFGAGPAGCGAAEAAVFVGGALLAESLPHPDNKPTLSSPNIATLKIRFIAALHSA
jgi:hypothetical protein